LQGRINVKNATTIYHGLYLNVGNAASRLAIDVGRIDCDALAGDKVNGCFADELAAVKDPRRRGKMEGIKAEIQSEARYSEHKDPHSK
jgi:hypothetical protein